MWRFTYILQDFFTAIWQYKMSRPSFNPDVYGCYHPVQNQNNINLSASRFLLTIWLTPMLPFNHTLHELKFLFLTSKVIIRVNGHKRAATALLTGYQYGDVIRGNPASESIGRMGSVRKKYYITTFTYTCAMYITECLKPNVAEFAVLLPYRTCVVVTRINFIHLHSMEPYGRSCLPRCIMYCGRFRRSSWFNSATRRNCIYNHDDNIEARKW